jgi:alpha-tubulin suppressor-like RCC1 family protein
MNFSLALDSNGHVWSFGNASDGRLGLGNSSEKPIHSKRIEELSEIKSISAGYSVMELFWIILEVCGHLDTMNMANWDLVTQLSRKTPCKIEGIPQIVQISSGYSII